MTGLGWLVDNTFDGRDFTLIIALLAVVAVLALLGAVTRR